MRPGARFTRIGHPFAHERRPACLWNMMAPDQPIDVSVLLVSFNTKPMTLAALGSIAAGCAGLSHEIIAVDNASSDGSAEAIRAHEAAPRSIALDENIGFARANNLAASAASGDYILLLNPDTVVAEGAIRRLVDVAKRRPEALIWGGRTLFADGRLNPSSCWARMSLWNLFCRASGLTGLYPQSELFNGEAYGAWPRDRERDVDIVSGCFLLIERRTWQRLGGFDPTFFMYGEEADLCLRARAIGARPIITPEATIIHHGGASEATRAGKMVRLLAAKATLIKRHMSRPAQPLALGLLAAWPLTRTLALRAASRLTGSTRAAEAAAVWAEIWRRRGEWVEGYADLHNVPAPAVLPPSTPTDLERAA